MKTKLILVRHGHCDKSGAYCGSSDAPLTEKGRQQARAVAKILSAVPISLCHSSPLSRAHETARIICSVRRIPIVPSPLLKEIDFGLWEGHTYSEIAAEWPEQAKHWLSDPTQVTIPGGESFSAFCNRVQRFLQGLSNKNSPGHILVVAHGGPIAVLLMEICGKPISEFFKLIPSLGSVQMVDCCLQDVCAEAQ